MGARKEAYKRLSRKIGGFVWRWPGQVPPSEKVGEELLQGTKNKLHRQGDGRKNASRQAIWVDSWVAGSVVEGKRWVRLWREAVAESLRALDLKKSLNLF